MRGNHDNRNIVVNPPVIRKDWSLTFRILFVNIWELRERVRRRSPMLHSRMSEKAVDAVMVWYVSQALLASGISHRSRVELKVYMGRMSPICRATFTREGHRARHQNPVRHHAAWVGFMTDNCIGFRHLRNRLMDIARMNATLQCTWKRLDLVNNQ